MRKMLALGALGLGAAGLGAAAAFELRIHPMWRSWGIDPDEAGRPLPGDDLVAEPAVVDTRGITIDAPPSAVWPWLMQMGYGRAGWYSYDALDMRGKSARAIVPEWQATAVGDVLPTDPNGGFRVKVVEPERALVLYLDPSDMAKWARNGKRAMVPADDGEVADPAVKPEAVPAGLAVSGGFLAAATPSELAASWAFVLEPLAGDRTRLIERYRVWFGDKAQAKPIVGQAMGLGVFIMTRRQMLGIRERAEETTRAGRQAETTPPTDVLAPVAESVEPVRRSHPRHEPAIAADEAPAIEATPATA